jgi:hypothetical protein
MPRNLAAAYMLCSQLQDELWEVLVDRERHVSQAFLVHFDA